MAVDKKKAKSLSNEGVKLLQQRMYDIAIIKFDRALELDPESVEVWHNKGLAYREAKKYKEAVECFDKALELNPDLFRTLISKGDTFMMQKFNLEAAELFFGLMKKGISPGKVQKRLDRIKNEPGMEEGLSGKSLYEQGLLEEALAQLEFSIEKNYDDRKVHFLKGEILRKLGRFDDALLVFDEILVKFEMVDAYKEKALCLLKQDSYKEAGIAIKEFLNHRPDDPGGMAIYKKYQTKMLKGAMEDDGKEDELDREKASREKFRENCMKVFCILGIIFFVYLWTTKTQRLISQLENSDNKNEKIEAISDLSSHNGDEVFNSLMKALVDKSPGVRATTINALGTLGDMRAVEPMLKILKKDGPEVRYVVCISLAKLKAEETIPDLIDTLKNDPSDFVRGGAAKALGRIGNTNALEPLCESATSEEEVINVRVLSIIALSSFKETRSFEVLKELINSNDERIRFNVVQGMGILGDKRAIPVLKEALNKETKEPVSFEINKVLEDLEKRSD